jgi:hypothetical protein
MSEQLTVSETLYRAADLIEERGWGGLAPGVVYESSYCAGNAIFASGPNWAAAQAVLIEHIGGKSIGDIWRWNDSPERTKAEVIEALRAAAVIAASRETAAVREQVPA